MEPPDEHPLDGQRRRGVLAERAQQPLHRIRAPQRLGRRERAGARRVARLQLGQRQAPRRRPGPPARRATRPAGARPASRALAVLPVARARRRSSGRRRRRRATAPSSRPRAAPPAPRRRAPAPVPSEPPESVTARRAASGGSSGGLEPFLEEGVGQRREGHAQAAAPDRGQQRVGCEETSTSVVSSRRLLQRLEQGVLGLRRSWRRPGRSPRSGAAPRSGAGRGAGPRARGPGPPRCRATACARPWAPSGRPWP